jgi:hypothetical protein
MINLLLVVLISFQTLNACSGIKVNHNNKITEITQTVPDTCKRCDIEAVKETVSNLEKLEYSDIFQFLYTFSKDCSKNVEYSEYSNEVLFKVLEKYPEQLMSCMSKEKNLDLDYILSELSTPILDINGKVIYERVQNALGDKLIKKKVLEAIKKAIAY